jgi:hypothetical protein
MTTLLHNKKVNLLKKLGGDSTFASGTTIAHTVSCSEIVGEYGQRPLYRMLGYFSIIGLLRVHVLLGDFTLGLKVMENVELNQKA